MDDLRRMWPVTVDLFATSLSFCLQVYFSPVNDPLVVGTDAFLQDWNGLQAYTFLHFALARQVLTKLFTCRGAELTLIEPIWPQNEWFPDLLSLSIAPPVILPKRRDLLRQPHFHRLHQHVHVLQLHAWRLSSNSSDT